MRSSLSFRDPDGSVLCTGERVVRSVAAQRVPEFTEFLNSRTAQALISAESLIGTRALSEFKADPQLDEQRREFFFQSFASSGRLFEHERVWFPSYPYEWPPEMLFAAGRLTLDVAEAALEEGYGLKDATPFNILFKGPDPVFIDLLSFERRQPDNATWLPYAQLLRMFVLPLLAAKYFGSKPHELLGTHPHGIEPEELYARCSWRQRLRPSFLSTVSIPAWLGRKAQSAPPVKAQVRTRETGAGDFDKTRFILRTQFRHLRKLLEKIEPEGKTVKSIWSGYTSTMSYSPEEFENKRQLIGRWLGGAAAKTVLDIGCNTGAFSEIAARLGAAVVAVDSDPVVVGRLWKRASRERLNVLPLVLDLAHPTPATGWENSENASFLDRAAGRFDTVMMLAVLHHLLVTERVPLTGVLNLAANLTRKDLILEYVDRADPMFQQLLRGRDALHDNFTREFFESTCQQQFTIVEKQPVKSNLRALYLLRKK
jgi:SAM-dependent methyltransferase